MGIADSGRFGGAVGRSRTTGSGSGFAAADPRAVRGRPGYGRFEGGPAPPDELALVSLGLPPSFASAISHTLAQAQPISMARSLFPRGTSSRRSQGRAEDVLDWPLLFRASIQTGHGSLPRKTPGGHSPANLASGWEGCHARLRTASSRPEHSPSTSLGVRPRGSGTLGRLPGIPTYSSVERCPCWSSTVTTKRGP
jgi:hypothetical protein